MLKVILDRHILFILMGVFTALGVISKCVANITLKRLVKAAGNMNKSTHPLIRLVRAKFEHACMVSDKVQNVGVFVDKFLYEYKTLGMGLHRWRRLEKVAAWLCVITGAAAAALSYSVYGMNDQVLQYGALGAGLAIFLFLFHLTSDENYQLEAAKNYMVDYLENVCAHRYEKAYQKEIQVMAPQEAAEAKKAIAESAKTEGVKSGSVKTGSGVSEEAPVRAVLPEAKEAEGAAVKSSQSKVSALKARARGGRAEKEKQPAREIQPEAPEEKVPEIPQPGHVKPQEEVPVHTPEIPQPVNMPQPETAGASAMKKQPVSKEVLIREILEEFLA